MDVCRRFRRVSRTAASLTIVALLFSPLQPVLAQALEAPEVITPPSDVTPESPTTPVDAPPAEVTAAPAIETDPLPETTAVPDEAQATPAIAEKPIDDESAPQALMSGQGATSPTLSNPNLFSYQTLQPRVDRSTGALAFSVPLDIPKGRAGLEPKLSLTYNSAHLDDHGIVGYGWNVSIPYIERINKRGLENLYVDNYFSSSLSGELATSTATSTYSARVDDGSFIRYTFSQNGWTAYDKQGTRYTFASSTSAQLVDPNDSTRIARWMLTEVRDTNDNVITYSYTKDGNQIYPSSIVYTGSGSTPGAFTVSFSLANSSVSMVSYRSGFQVTTEKRISTITASQSSTMLRQYNLSYTAGNNGYRSLLWKVEQQGRGTDGTTTTMPPIIFSYENTAVTSIGVDGEVPSAAYAVADANGDSLSDESVFMLNQTNSTVTGEVNGSSIGTVPEYWARYQTSGQISEEVGTRFVDVNGDGLADIARNDGTTTRLYLNVSSSTLPTYSFSQIATTSIVGGIPTFKYVASGSFASAGLFGNLNGDTAIDYTQWVGSVPSTKSSHLGNGLGWYSTTTIYAPVFEMPGLSGSPVTNSQLIDINADGLDDWVYSFTDVTNVCFNTGLAWQTSCSSAWSLGTTTFFYNPSTSLYYDRGIRFLDVNGDGLTDFVRSYSNASTGNGAEFGTSSLVMLNTGSGWATSTATFNYLIASYDTAGTLTNRETYDDDGDGVPTNTTRHDLLKTITYPQQGTTNVSYANPAALGSNAQLGLPRLVVTSLASNDQNGTTDTRTYSYSGGKLYTARGLLERAFAGFNTVTETRDDGVRKTYFNQGDAAETTLGERTDGFPFIGKPYREDISSTAGTLLKRTFYQWATNTDEAGGGESMMMSYGEGSAGGEEQSAQKSRFVEEGTQTQQSAVAQKSATIIAAVAPQKVQRQKYEIEIVSVEAIDGGVQVFARAWNGKEQIGFGEDGSVDIERFRIFNPPLLVEDEKGSIERTYVTTDPETKEESVTTKHYREDPTEAVLQVIEHNLSVMKNIHTSEKIEHNKIGKTTSTFFAGSGNGAVQHNNANGYSQSNWDLIHDATTGTSNEYGIASSNNLYSPGRWSNASYIQLFRAFYPIDTSALGSNQTITNATWSIYVTDHYSASVPSGAPMAWSLVQGSQASTSSLSNDDYDAYATTRLASDIDNSSVTDNAYNTWTLNSSGRAAVSLTGTTKLAMLASHDLDDYYTSSPNWVTRLLVRYADYSGTTYDPKLVVEHQTSGSGSGSSGNAPEFSLLKSKMVQLFDHNGSGTHRDSATHYHYSSTTADLLTTTEWGEVIGASDATFTDTGSDTRTTTRTYARNDANNLSALATEILTNNADTKVRETRRYYDNATTTSVTNGNLTKEENWITGTTYASTTRSYNAFGLVAASTDPRGNTTLFGYDSTLNRDVASSTNALGHLVQRLFDPASGQATQVTDANGLIREFVYDGVGRLKEEKQPDLTTPSTLRTKRSITYTDNTLPSSVLTTNYFDLSTSTASYEYFDGFGRSIQTRTKASPVNTFAVTTKHYNPVGLASKSSLPHFASSSAWVAPALAAALFATTTFDALERPVTLTTANGTTTYAYNGWDAVNGRRTFRECGLSIFPR